MRVNKVSACVVMVTFRHSLQGLVLSFHLAAWLGAILAHLTLLLQGVKEKGEEEERGREGSEGEGRGRRERARGERRRRERKNREGERGVKEKGEEEERGREGRERRECFIT